jgi:hypothetical protein
MVGLLVIVPASLLDDFSAGAEQSPIALECRRQKGSGPGWWTSPGDSPGKPAGELAAGAAQMVSKAETGHLLWQGPLGDPRGAQRLEVGCCVFSYLICC